MTEAKGIMTDVIQALLLRDALVMRLQGGNPGKGNRPAMRWMVRGMEKWSSSGQSDVLALLDGIFYAFETKTVESLSHGYKPSQDQLRFILSVNERGGIAKVIYNVEEIWKS